MITHTRSRSVVGIPKLYDANWAGTEKGNECTLILTEGDSAKALAVSGLSSLGILFLYYFFPPKFSTKFS